MSTPTRRSDEAVRLLAIGLIGYPETAQSFGANVRAQVEAGHHPSVPYILDVIEHHCNHNYTEALAAAEAAQQEIGASEDPNWHLLAVLTRVRALGKNGRHREAIDLVLSVEESIPTVDPLLGLILHWQLGFEYRRNGQLSESFRYTYAARMEALRIGADRELATITSDLGNLHLESGDPVKALAHYEEAVHLTRLLDEQQMVDLRLANVATAMQRLDRNAEAAEIYRGILKRNEDTLSKGMRLGILANLAISLKRQELYSEAEALYQEITRIVDTMPAQARSVNALSGLANLYVLQERYPDALQVLHRARSVAEQLDSPHLMHELNWQRADVLNSLGETDESLELLRAAFRGMKESTFTRITLEIGAALEERLREQGAFQEAYDVLKFCSHLRESVYEAESERAVELGQVRTAIESERRSLQAQEKQRRKLLIEVLPENVADRLMNGERRIADRLEMVGVLFADIVGFTDFAANKTPDQVLSSLEDLFHSMDEIISTHDCEKIKTIGDAYMATSSINTTDAVAGIARLAQCGLDFLDLVSQHDSQRMSLRIGMHAGPVVAGVMGGKRIAYDMWGDTVNIASRMESTSEGGRLQTTKAVADILSSHPQFTVEFRARIDVRGRGQMDTFWVSKAP